MSTVFDDAQFERNYPPGIERNFWHQCRNRIIYHTLKKHKFGTHIVEVGCGKGTTAQYLQDKNISITGVELGNPLIPEQRTTYIHTNTAAEHLPQHIREKTTALCFFDVIEHIERPAEFLTNILKNYPNVNTLIITVPACTSLWSHFDEINGHLRRYNKKQLDETIKKIKFNPVYTSYFFRLLYLPILLKRKIFKHKPESPAPPQNTLIHTIISRICLMDFFLLPSQLPGSSLLCVAKKHETHT